MKFLGEGFQKLEHEQDRQTDRCDRVHYHPRSKTSVSKIID